MSSIIPFSFESHQVRIVDQNGYAWAVLKDVLAAAKTSTRPTDAVESIKQSLGDEVVNDYPIPDALGRAQNTIIIREEAVTYLLAQSRTEDGKRLNRFIHMDVLPSIHRTGSYTAPKAIPADRPTKVFPEYFRIAKLIGLDKNAAALSANQATYKKTGENVLALMGITHLEAEQPWFSPTELGKRIDVSGRQFNLLLLESGLQIKEGDHWLPTDAAKGLCRFFDTSKKHMDGTVVQQLKWSGDVLGLINREAA